MNSEQVMEKLKHLKFTQFQINVLMAVYLIPKGETKTYSQIALEVGHPKACRAVGTVLRNNPLAPIIPCHRVIKKDGSLGNYSGKGGVKTKETMLRSEGAID
jgi:methylated-DNA-[protein]-cysteine S-methyltransferase